MTMVIWNKIDISEAKEKVDFEHAQKSLQKIELV